MNRIHTWCVVFAGLALLGLSVRAADIIDWRTDWPAAYQEARDRNAPVFIFLSQDG